MRDGSMGIVRQKWCWPSSSLPRFQVLLERPFVAIHRSLVRRDSNPDCGKGDRKRDADGRNRFEHAILLLHLLRNLQGFRLGCVAPLAQSVTALTLFTMNFFGASVFMQLQSGRERLVNHDCE